MIKPPEEKDQVGDLRELDDFEFFAQWAVIRSQLFCIPETKPEYREIKRQYDAVLAEYRRRIYGASI
jgi:hypothetical protein